MEFSESDATECLRGVTQESVKSKRPLRLIDCKFDTVSCSKDVQVERTVVRQRLKVDGVLSGTTLRAQKIDCGSEISLKDVTVENVECDGLCVLDGGVATSVEGEDEVRVYNMTRLNSVVSGDNMELVGCENVVQAECARDLYVDNCKIKKATATTARMDRSEVGELAVNGLEAEFVSCKVGTLAMPRKGLKSKKTPILRVIDTTIEKEMFRGEVRTIKDSRTSPQKRKADFTLDKQGKVKTMRGGVMTNVMTIGSDGAVRGHTTLSGTIEIE